jgi:uncharacterized membrane protein
MEEATTQRVFRKAFLATIIVNGCIAVADMVAGAFFLFEHQITALLYYRQYPFSATIQSILMTLFAQNQLMGILYFFSHGTVKLILVWGLLTHRLWAYPLAIVILSGFSIYQAYDLFHHMSYFTLLLIVVNILTIFFITREWRYIKMLDRASAQAKGGVN